MTVALIILAALVGAGILLYAHERITARTRRGAEDTAGEEARQAEAEQQGCCGMHISCEKDSLSTAASTEIVYYDDDELDSYAGRPANSYTDAETEQFRDILLTLLPDDIAGWARSLQLRNIEMPESVRQELLLIVSEARMAKLKTSSND